MGGPTPLARSVQIDGLRNATDADVVARFHPLVAAAVARLPRGDAVFHGLPFHLGSLAQPERWVLLDGPLTVDLDAAGEGSHLVVAHLADTWRDDQGNRPPGLATGYVVPIGEALAHYTLIDAAGRRRTTTIRRRFEINDGLLGWGSAAFAAVPHREN